jgi:hypothetical protein
MFAIGTRVVDRIAHYGVFGNGATVTGTVIGVSELVCIGGEWQWSEVLVEWDAIGWSDYRKPEYRATDELAELLAV